MKSVVLCIDETSLSHPECVGLEGECLVAQTWLRTFSGAKEARRASAKAQEVAEVWVVSNDEVEPINLAAALKQDRPDRAVFLVSGDPSGSLMSRANSAGLDGVLTQAEFVSRYIRWKKEDLHQVYGQCAPERSVSMIGLDAVRPDCGAQAVSSRLGNDCGGHANPMDYKDEVFVRPLGKHAAKVKVDVAKEDGDRIDPPAVTIGRVGSPDAPLTQDAAANVAQRRGSQTQSLGQVSLAKPMELAPTKRAFLLPVISASGGSGKSAVAALAAMLTHRAGLKTLLLDLDLQFGDMRETFGGEGALSVDDLLAAPVRIEQVVAANDGPALLCSPRNLEAAEDVVERLPELLDLVCSRFDVVVANTGGFWTDEHMVLLERCSRALFLIDQRPSSLRACQRALDLCMKCGIAASPLVFAVNKCSKQGLYTSIDVSCALHGADSRELYWGGGQVAEMMSSGQVLELVSSRNALVESLEVVLGELVPNMPQVGESRNASRFSLWGMLTGRSREEQPCL